MRRLVRYTLIVIAACAALAATLYFVFPRTLLTLVVDGQRWSAGLTWKDVRVDNHRIVYLEGGTGETVVLLHGFGVSKDDWLSLAGRLKGYRLVIPDVPGFGESSQVPSDNYGIESQAARIDRFAQALSLDRFHLAGNSAGGALAAVYAARHPERVITLMLEDAAGALSPTKSPLDAELEQGRNPLLIHNVDDLDRIMQLVSFTPRTAPRRFKDVIVADAVARGEFTRKMWDDFVGGPEKSLARYLPLIQAPALIVWGDQDKLTDVGGVPFLERNLKNARTLILKDTGHVPHVEKPEDVARAYLAFLHEAR